MILKDHGSKLLKWNNNGADSGCEINNVMQYTSKDNAETNIDGV